MAVNINSLGQVLDTTWGRSSTPMTASMSVKMKILDNDRFSVTFVTIENFGSGTEMIQTRRKLEEQAASIVRKILENVKSNYRDIEGKAITLKEVGDPEVSIELVGGSPWNNKRTSMFKRISIVMYS
jgi:hypothetical protein